jgi:hypothetical protein
VDGEEIVEGRRQHGPQLRAVRARLRDVTAVTPSEVASPLVQIPPLTRTRRLLPAVVGVLLVAQLTAVATASTGSGRLDLPGGTTTSTAGGTNLAAASPSLDVDVAGVQVHVGADDADDPSADRGDANQRGESCGADDKPETGIQGDVPLADQLSGRANEGYNCGLQVVAYNSLGDRTGNANMAWTDDCAFIAGTGVAVVDMSDPLHPTQVTTLHTPGSEETAETIAAGTYDGRSILVAGRYGLYFDFHGESTSPVDIYDVTDCTHPVLLSTARVPQAVHNLTLTKDLTRIYSTLPVQGIDITDPRNPKMLGSMEPELQATGVFRFEWAHEINLSDDGNTMYIGGQTFFDEGSMVLDITDWPQRPLQVIASYTGPGHSIRSATINGRKYLLRSDESIVNPTALGCLPDLTPFGGAAQPYLTDITDPTHPVDVSRLTLDINDPSNCATQLLSGVNASSHYHDVDDPQNTTFAMVSMWNAGLRIFDLRNPSHPVEAAYFNPGMFNPALLTPGNAVSTVLGLVPRYGMDQAWAHIRYVEDTGQIWLTTATGGFWVLELEPQLRARLGLPSVPSHAPLAGNPRPAASRTFPQQSFATTASLYCTLAPAQAVLTSAR